MNTNTGNRRFIYFYFNRNEPEKIREVVPAHVQYWKTANLKSYSGGPFADHSGGLILCIRISSSRKETHKAANPEFIVCLAPCYWNCHSDWTLLSIVCHLFASFRAKQRRFPRPNFKAPPTVDECFSANLHGDWHLSYIC